MVQAYVNRSAIYLQRRDSDGAIGDASKAIELDPSMAHAYANRAMACHQRSGGYEQAIADFVRAFDLDPRLVTEYGDKLGQDYASRALSYKARGDPQSATRAFDDALRVAQDPALVRAVRQELERLR